MKAEARRHLKVKLAAYWSRVRIDHDDLDIYGRDEEDAATSSEPPSRFDSAERHGV